MATLGQTPETPGFVASDDAAPPLNLRSYWQNILNRRSAAWQPLSPEDIHRIFPTLKVLREIQEYYLRNITVCMVQCIVRMQFNCDGTQIVDARNLQKFLQENLP